MLIQNRLPAFSSAPRVAAQNKDNQPPVEPPKDDRKELDEKNFSWLDLGKGVAGSLVGGAIEGAGIGASSLIRSPQVAFHSVKGLWKSKMLGPVLKATLTPVVITAGLVAPVFAALGGTLYGMFEGFKEGAEKSPLAVPAAAGNTVREFHTKWAGQAVEGVQNLAAQEPQSSDQVYEIRLIEAGKGLIAGAAGAVVTGAGVAASSLVNLPRAYVRGNQEIWKSEAALPLKVGGSLLATGAAVVAVPFAAVGGALWGLGSGAYHGYKDGLLPAIGDAAKDVKTYHQGVSEAIHKD